MMFDENTLLVVVIAVALIVLSLVQLWLAYHHDRAVTAAGPIEELAVYERRIEGKRQEMNDLEAEVEKRRQALAVKTDLQAEVDGLRNQIETLLTEWESLRERREEVQAVRRENEEAAAERLNLNAELAPLRAEYLEVKERLQKAEDLAGQTERLRAEHEEITRKVAGMRAELQRLSDAEKRIENLSDQAREMEADNARLEGRITSQEAELRDMGVRVTHERRALAEAQSEHGRIAAETATETIELRRVQGELPALEARQAYLQEEIARAEGRTPDDAKRTDQLQELKKTPPVISEMTRWSEAPDETETEAIRRTEQRLEDRGLVYPPRTLRAFHTAMKVNETTQMAVLAGISGTGKSQLPRQYAAGMGIGFLQIPVQPRWDSPQDLMGFYNYVEQKFRPTDMARALWALDEENNKDNAVKDRMMLILLDEMNLARVEYYFSDFLSRLESRPAQKEDDRNERKDAEIELEIPNMLKPPRIFPGYNLLFAGTMNEDESTQSLSDKVVDRANILRFPAPGKIKSGVATRDTGEPLALSRKRWKSWVKPVSVVEDDKGVRENLDRMVDLMRDFKRPFGHRLGRAIMAYVANYPVLEGAPPHRDAFADQVEMRLLPKLRGVEVDGTQPFDELRKFVTDLGDDKLADAIDRAVSESADSTGQFVWSGVTR